MLTSGLKAIDKRFKMKILFWNLCIQHIKTLKSNFFFYIKVINCFYFLNLNKTQFFESLKQRLGSRTLFAHKPNFQDFFLAPHFSKATRISHFNLISTSDI